MRILALQLKRIGDLVLTTPALTAIKSALPDAHVCLAVDAACASLLPAIPPIDSAIVFGSGRGWAPWQQVLTGRFEVVLDFTGTDRSALVASLSRARRRIGFAWTREKGFRARAYNSHIESTVRDRHTVTHYCDLLDGFVHDVTEPPLALRVPEESARTIASALAQAWPHGVTPYAVLHPGTARVEKNWLSERWSEVKRHLLAAHGLRSVISAGPNQTEWGEAMAVKLVEIPVPESISSTVLQPPDLCAFAALLRDAALVVSCDTAAVHLAAAFQRPQVALFGPTNPFHWRPRHDRAVVISAAEPDAPMTTFNPRLKGAPMERISTRVVCDAIDALLFPNR